MKLNRLIRATFILAMMSAASTDLVQSAPSAERALRPLMQQEVELPDAKQPAADESALPT